MKNTTIFLLVGALLSLLERPIVYAQPEEKFSDVETTSRQVLDAHNAVRAQAGLPPLKLRSLLTTIAQEHAQDMAAHKRLSHKGSDGSMPEQRLERHGYRYQRYGENVAVGPETVPAVMEQWLQSAPHRQNILGDFTELGVARALAADGMLYWCVVFARPAASTPPAAGD